MKKKIFLFSALGSLIIGAAAATAICLTTPRKGEVFDTRALTPPTDVEEYDAWLNSWSKPNHLYVHYNRGDKNDYDKFCFWMWNDETDTDGTLWAYGGTKVYTSVTLNPMSEHWMYESDIKEGESGIVYKDSYGVIADIDLGGNLKEGKVKNGSSPKSCSYDDCEDFGFLFPQISSMNGANHWTSDGGKDNDVDDWREEENWRTISGGKCIHIFFSSGQLMNYSYYAGSGIPQVKVNPIDSDTTGKYSSKTETITDKYPNQTAPTSSSFKKLGVGYQIFVASFRDSNGDGIGDLRGVIDSLDYLKDLGVEVLWLTPIQKCGSYHGYDIIDYYDVDKRFGTVDDYRELLFKAHQKGMKVLMDLVLNHTSKNNTWFIKSEWGVNSFDGAETDGTGIKWRDVYTWKFGKDKIKTAEKFKGDYEGQHDIEQIKSPLNYIDQYVEDNAASLNGASWFKSGESNYYYYGKFGSDMPELNYENNQTRKLVQDMAKYWMSFGLDGFRLDAVKHIYMKDEVSNPSDKIIPDVGMKKAYDEQNERYIYKPYDYSQDLKKNIEFWKEFAIELKKVYPDCFLVGENFDGYGQRIAGYYQALDSQFDFSNYFHIPGCYNNWKPSGYAYNQGKETFDAFADSNDQKIDVSGSEMYVPGGKRPDFINGSFTSNHDVMRAINQANGTQTSPTDIPAKEKVNGTAEEIGRAKVHAALTLFSPGVSWIYYGDELGMSSNVDQHIALYDNENCVDTWYRQPFMWQGEKGNEVRPHYVNGKYQFNSDSYDSYNKSLFDAQKGIKLEANGSFSSTNDMYEFYKGITAIKKLYPEAAKVTYDSGLTNNNVVVINVSGTNGKPLRIFVNTGNEPGSYGIDEGGKTLVGHVNCGTSASDFPSYSVKAYQINN